jgi:hypothetical protein
MMVGDQGEQKKEGDKERRIRRRKREQEGIR